MAAQSRGAGQAAQQTARAAGPGGTSVQQRGDSGASPPRQASGRLPAPTPSAPTLDRFAQLGVPRMPGAANPYAQPSPSAAAAGMGAAGGMPTAAGMPAGYGSASDLMMSGTFGPYGFNIGNLAAMEDNPASVLPYAVGGYNPASPGGQFMQNLPFDVGALANLAAFSGGAGDPTQAAAALQQAIAGIYQGVAGGQWIDPRAVMGAVLNPAANSPTAQAMANMNTAQQASYIGGLARMVAGSTMPSMVANAFMSQLNNQLNNAVSNSMTQNPAAAGFPSLIANQLGGNVMVDPNYVMPGMGLTGIPFMGG